MAVKMEEIRHFVRTRLLENTKPEELDDKKYMAEIDNLVNIAGLVAESFCTRVKDGGYTFYSHEEISLTELNWGITPATRLVVDKAHFISMAEPFPKPEFAHPTALMLSIWEMIEASVAVDRFLHNVLDNEWSNTCREVANGLSIRGSPIMALASEVVACLVASSNGVLRSPSLNGRVVMNYNRAFLYFYTFLLVRHETGMNRLRSLMNLMAKVIPLGEKADEPGTWLVLKP